MPIGETIRPAAAAAAPKRQGPTGFTLIELLVVLTIIASLLMLSLPRYMRALDSAAQTVLAENLRLTRDAIDKHFSDTGRYPDSLEQLVDKGYLRSLPLDPVTDSTQTWVIEGPATGAAGRVFNLRSGAAGLGLGGKPYAAM
ncbi:MAG: prepilin-type N-terminal cleavage/methylation domain-containing protein [Aquabacterium sp.]|nr:prepilin-type N-terminal cleavage/methylation domain-containing protein [Aquabacterium sp.]